jgi:hypothetical protein
MSNWLAKSEASLMIAKNTASLLFNNRVHCYYYGNIQYMLHILYKEFKMEIDQITYESNPRHNGGQGSHLWLRNTFIKDLKRRGYRFDSLDLSNYLGILKHLRTCADYGYDHINLDALMQAHDLSNKVQEILTRRFI